MSVDTCARGQILSPYTKNEDEESVISYNSNGSGTLRSALHIIEDIEAKQTKLAAASEGFLDLQKKVKPLQASLRQKSLDLKVKNAQLETCKVEVSLLTRTLHKAFASAHNTISGVDVEQEHENQDDYYEDEKIKEGKRNAKTKTKNKYLTESGALQVRFNQTTNLHSFLSALTLQYNKQLKIAIWLYRHNWHALEHLV